jgi:geranylgeranylglycerol-phosphate geranylgeranyltransferase
MKSFFQLIRLPNIFIGELTLIILIWILRPAEISSAFWLGSLVVFLIMAGANILNDILDLETDRVNRPDRPLVSGRISLRVAEIFSFSAFTLAVLLSFPLKREAMGISFLAVLLLLFYTSDFKKIPFWGNFTVALVSGLLLVFGGTLLGNAKNSLIPALLAFGVHLLREIIKDFEDREGDAEAGIATLATSGNPDRGIKIIRLTALLFILFLVAVILSGKYGLFFTLLTVPLIIIPLSVFLLRAKNNVYEKKYFHTFSLFLKLSMVIGLAALGGGKWFTG